MATVCWCARRPRHEAGAGAKGALGRYGGPRADPRALCAGAGGCGAAVVAVPGAGAAHRAHGRGRTSRLAGQARTDEGPASAGAIAARAAPHRLRRRAAGLARLGPGLRRARADRRGGRTRHRGVPGHPGGCAGPVAGTSPAECTRVAHRCTADARARRTGHRQLGRHRGARPAVTLMPRRSHPIARARNSWSWAGGGLLLGVLAGLLLFAPASWLAQWLARRTDGHVVLAQARGTIWNGSAQLVLAAGADSQLALTLPGRLAWSLHPAWGALLARVDAPCCTAQPLQLRITPRWNGARLALADGRSQWPAAVLAGLGAPWNTVQLEGLL